MFPHNNNKKWGKKVNKFIFLELFWFIKICFTYVFFLSILFQGKECDEKIYLIFITSSSPRLKSPKKKKKFTHFIILRNLILNN